MNNLIKKIKNQIFQIKSENIPDLVKEVKGVVGQHCKTGEVIVNNNRISLKTEVGILYLYAHAVIEKGMPLCKIKYYTGENLKGIFN